MSFRQFAASIAVAVFLPVATGCDGLPVDDTRPESSSAVEADGQHSAVGRVVFEHETLLVPAAGAQVIIEAISPEGDARELAPFELATDADGYFVVPALPEGIERVTANVFVDGEFAGTQEIEVEVGQPIAKAVVVIAVTAWMVCVATMWASAKKQGSNDKDGHCIASCRTTRWCGGPGTTMTVGVLKETFDTLCQYGPQWLKDLLRPMSACGGWDNGDMLANTRGIACAAKLWRNCNSCCDDWY
jgi:hypothetical protein